VSVRRELDERGFAVVRGLVPPDEVAALAAAFDDLLALARTLPGPTDVDGARFVVDAEPFRLHRVVWCGGASPVIARYGADPRFVRLAVDVLGVDPVSQLIQQAHFKLPGDGVGFGWHQDASNRRYGSPRVARRGRARKLRADGPRHRPHVGRQRWAAGPCPAKRCPCPVSVRVCGVAPVRDHRPGAPPLPRTPSAWHGLAPRSVGLSDVS
jgi:hypothetical protein